MTLHQTRLCSTTLRAFQTRTQAKRMCSKLCPHLAWLSFGCPCASSTTVLPERMDVPWDLDLWLINCWHVLWQSHVSWKYFLKLIWPCPLQPCQISQTTIKWCASSRSSARLGTEARAMPLFANSHMLMDREHWRNSQLEWMTGSQNCW